MLFLALLLLLGLALPKSTLCLLGHEIEELSVHPDQLLSLSRRADSSSNESVAVTGITGFASPQTRLEIRELEKNKDAWNIYLLGSV